MIYDDGHTSYTDGRDLCISYFLVKPSWCVAFNSNRVPTYNKLALNFIKLICAPMMLIIYVQQMHTYMYIKHNYICYLEIYFIDLNRLNL